MYVKYAIEALYSEGIPVSQIEKISWIRRWGRSFLCQVAASYHTVTLLCEGRARE